MNSFLKGLACQYFQSCTWGWAWSPWMGLWGGCTASPSWTKNKGLCSNLKLMTINWDNSDINLKHGILHSEFGQTLMHNIWCRRQIISKNGVTLKIYLMRTFLAFSNIVINSCMASIIEQIKQQIHCQCHNMFVIHIILGNVHNSKATTCFCYFLREATPVTTRTTTHINITLFSVRGFTFFLHG